MLLEVVATRGGHALLEAQKSGFPGGLLISAAGRRRCNDLRLSDLTRRKYKSRGGAGKDRRDTTTSTHSAHVHDESPSAAVERHRSER